jgi:hypothetical protein
LHVSGFHARLGKNFIAHHEGAAHQVQGELLYFFAGDRNHAAAFGSRSVDARNRDGCLLGLAELALGELAGENEAVEGHRVIAEIPAVACKRPVGDVKRNGSVDVVATEIWITAVSNDAKRIAAAVDDRRIEGAAAQVVHERVLQAATVQVRERGGDWLLDDPNRSEVRLGDGERGRVASALVEAYRGGDDSVHILYRTLGELTQASNDGAADVDWAHEPGAGVEKKEWCSSGPSPACASRPCRSGWPHSEGRRPQTASRSRCPRCGGLRNSGPPPYWWYQDRFLRSCASGRASADQRCGV